MAKSEHMHPLRENIMASDLRGESYFKSHVLSAFSQFYRMNLKICCV